MRNLIHFCTRKRVDTPVPVRWGYGVATTVNLRKCPRLFLQKPHLCMCLFGERDLSILLIVATPQNIFVLFYSKRDFIKSGDLLYVGNGGAKYPSVMLCCYHYVQWYFLIYMCVYMYIHFCKTAEYAGTQNRLYTYIYIYVCMYIYLHTYIYI